MVQQSAISRRRFVQTTAASSLALVGAGQAAQATAARERARLASAMADKAELGNARLRGSLLDTGDVRSCR